MNYAEGYLNATSLADQIAESARQGKSVAGLGGARKAKRNINRETELDGSERANFGESYGADYGTLSVGSVGGIFDDIDAEKIKDYLAGIKEKEEMGKVRPKTKGDVVYDRTTLDDNEVDYGTLVKGLRESAEELGMDPLDLATIVSYETAGSFDPTKKGPTTRWGKHKGLIQFGEPQQKEFGVDFADPYTSQLGANGAIVKYFKAKGFEKGMDITDAYSIVNAGAVGREDWSDSSSGGAPGTVAEKVKNQMVEHRAKARRLLEKY
tara:strand:- start:35 stop:832 length:798 start_codon:yes stop_codon:yes gene_type:complete